MAGVLNIGQINNEEPTIVTLATDVLTVTQRRHIVASQAGAADDLSTISVTATVPAGYVSEVILKADAGDTITIKDGVGNIELNKGVDYSLTGDKQLLLVYDGSNWTDVGDTSLTTQDLPNRATHFHDESTVTNGNALVFVVNPLQRYAHQTYQNVSVDADAFSFSVYLSPGDYTFYALGITDANQAIIDWDFGGGDDTIAGQDWYAAAENLNVIKSGAITLTVGGKIVVTGTINDNNVASGGFDMKLTKMWFKKAAD